AGGSFTTAGGVLARHIARWDGSAWSALSSGASPGVNNVVYTLLFAPDGSLYVGGEFTAAGGIPANRIARWDGSAWSALGSGLRGGEGCCNPPEALAFVGSDLYVGGHFRFAGNKPSSYIARWMTAPE
ncbi:MAG: delta-60 repeat domain-containing protein, partial [Candidatus Acidiferrales bacterium]